MEDKEIRPICLYKETCLDYKQGKRKCEDCIHNKEYWTEVQLRDMAQNIRRLKKENAELKAENVEIKTSYINFIAKLKREMITKDDIQDLKDTAKRFVEERNSLRKENAELKAENERLKAECDMYKTFYRAKHSDIKCLFIKYKQTLQEIKVIAERGFYNSQCNCGLRADIEQILQKITKAEEV